MVKTLEQQFLDLRGMLLGQAINYTRNREDAKDLVQDAYVLILQKLNKGEITESGSVSGYATTVIRNLFLNKYKKNKYQKKNALSIAYETETVSFINENAIDDKAEYKKWSDVISKNVTTLPIKTTRYLLRIIDGVPLKQVAEETGDNYQTIKTRVRRARELLKFANGSSMPDKKFRPVPGFEELYLVSEDGDVWSCRKNTLLKGKSRLDLQDGDRHKCTTRSMVRGMAWVPNPDGHRFFLNGKWVCDNHSEKWRKNTIKHA